MNSSNENSTEREIVRRLIHRHRGDETAFETLPPEISEVGFSLIEQFKKEVDLLIRRDAHEALAVAELAESLSKHSPDAAARALGARTKALALHVLGRYPEAVRYYEQAQVFYHQAERAVEAARIQRAMVDALIYLGRYDEALRLADEARGVFEAHGEKLLLAQLESNAGNVYHRLDRNAEALARYERAAELFAVCAPEQLAQVTFNRANVYCNLDDFHRAQELYELAHELHCRNQDELGAAQTRYSIGYLHFLRGAYHQAMRVLHQARIECRQLGDEQTAALCVLDLAEIHLQLNVFDDAARLAAEARESFQSLGMRYEAARAATFLGLAQLRMGPCHPSNLEEAEQAFAIADEEFTAEGNEVHLGLLSLYRAELWLLRGETAQAVALAEAAEHTFSRQELRTKICLAQIIKAGALIDAGQVDLKMCEKVLRDCEALDVPWLRYRAHELLGDAYLAQEDWPRAQEQYTQSVFFIEQIRCRIRVDEFRSAFFGDKLRVYEKLIGLCLNRDQPMEAFYYLESSKARTLVDWLANDLELMPSSGNEAAAELRLRRQMLREKLHWHYGKMGRAETRGDGRRFSDLTYLRDEVIHCERELAEVTRQLQATDANFLWLEPTGGMTVEELRTLLARDEAVIEYYFDDETLKIFFIDRQSLQVVESPYGVSQIGELIRKLRFHMCKFQYGQVYLTLHSERLLEDVNDCLSQLRQALYDPVANLAKDRRLIFIPFGLLHNVPFQALFDGEKYLIEGHEITQAPSARVLKLCAAAPVQSYERVSIFGAADEIAPQITEEIQAIRALFPTAECFAGAMATADSLRRKAPASDILHLAGHAVFRQDAPMFSAFKLADTWLNFYDICALRLPASLVTLSGCSTGASRIYAGDELMGLARGFLSAGAASLVVSLWAVNDPATARLMAAFYNHLRRGLTCRAALRAAALEVKSLHEHPYYWASFFIISHH
ncbi:MAG TPA: CHAT domain-containing protein [Blastocatellia bacterium]|nr:CHAT domain-containing protein [Blastocatellia bacterium]HMV87548.1 CHAT domain-containing protein [Blastocatellia bacterium]HMX26068.1 CHAT domain-containing protein [Blastocatellia bacterium]HMZ21916.1 CHAT domain-containing protein [Blastocatellia bacterium]